MIAESDKSIYFLALSMLYILKDTDEYRDISSLAFVLDRKNFDNFIDFFGGTTIKVPTRSELNLALKSLAYYQARYVEGYGTQKSMEISGVTQQELHEVSSRSTEISRFFKNLNTKVMNPDEVFTNN